MKLIIKYLFCFLYRVRVVGADRLRVVSGGSLFVVSHFSYLDIVLVALFLPSRSFTVLIDANDVLTRLAKFCLKGRQYKIIDFGDMNECAKIAESLKQGKSYLLFPELKVSNTGGIGKFDLAVGHILKQSGATVVPVFLENTQALEQTPIAHKMHTKRFPALTLHIGEECGIDVSKSDEDISNDLYEKMVELYFDASYKPEPLFQALRRTSKKYGKNTKIAKDITGQEISYHNIVLASFILGKKINALGGHQNVGIFLANSNACLISYFSTLAYGKIPTMLNFTSGQRVLQKVCTIAKIDTIITAKAFVQKADLGDVVSVLEKQCRVVYLEDLKSEITLSDKLGGIFKSTFASYFMPKSRAEDIATILFTSGTEGDPKGVALSHSNLYANMMQCKSLLSFTKEDVFFNALPMFHCFGLTAGSLLPLFLGLKTYLYTTPLHYAAIPRLLYLQNGTILIGTNTFLANYAKKASEHHFSKLNYVLAGAEKLKAETTKTYKDKFGITIIQGYGSTEASPVVSVNNFVRNQNGSVGKFLPRIEHRLETVEGIKNGYRLLIKGPNLKQHYIFHDRIQTLQEGWYDTGDIVSVGDNGFVTILDRLKRFAKIAGEMVPLGEVEVILKAIYPNAHSCAICVEESNKGEKVIVYTEETYHNKTDIIAYIKENALSNHLLPREIYTIDEIPLNTTGKIDYQRLKSEYLQTI